MKNSKLVILAILVVLALNKSLREFFQNRHLNAFVHSVLTSLTSLSSTINRKIVKRQESRTNLLAIYDPQILFFDSNYRHTAAEKTLSSRRDSFPNATVFRLAGTFFTRGRAERRGAERKAGRDDERIGSVLGPHAVTR